LNGYSASRRDGGERRMIQLVQGRELITVYVIITLMFYLLPDIAHAG
jgi:hypothetical protein